MNEQGFSPSRIGKGLKPCVKKEGRLTVIPGLKARADEKLGQKKDRRNERHDKKHLNK